MKPPSPRVRLALLVLVLIGAGLVIASRFRGDSGDVRASGVVEMDEVDVASRVGGRVLSLRVGEGDSVQVGDTLAVLDQGEVAAEARAQVAQSERAAAEALEVRRGPRAAEIGVARADLAAAAAALDLATRDFDRAKALLESQAIAKAEYDRAKSARDAAAARRRASAEALQILEEGSRREQVTASREASAAARANLNAAQSRLSELSITAPAKGVVLLRNFEPGELVNPGQPVVTLGNPDSLWIRVFVGAPLIERVRLGAPVEVRLEGISKRVYTGRVVEIASKAEFTPRAALTEEERANLVFGVKIVLDPSDGSLKAGLPADARIRAPRPATPRG